MTKGNSYHGKIEGYKSSPWHVVLMRTARRRYSLRVFNGRFLSSVRKFTSYGQAKDAMILTVRRIDCD